MTQQVPGVDRIEEEAAQRIANGIPAVAALKVLSNDPTNADALAKFNQHQQDLGYGFLVKRYAADQDVEKATPADIQKAAGDAVPNVFAMFWSFRVMVALGLAMLAYFVLAVIFSVRNDVERRRWFLRLAPWMIPIPFIANEFGWLTAEIGRQPWTVYGLLPTWMSASSHSVGYMVFSLIGFVTLYTIFIVIEMTLMVKFIRKGPADHAGKPPAPARQAAAGYAPAVAMMRKED
jgi:cytochrome d ubiquinol oxidase subunit I